MIQSMKQLRGKTLTAQVQQSQSIHTFSLKSLNQSTRCLSHLEVDFTNFNDKSENSTSNIPCFNKDGKYYTPAFVASSSKTQSESGEAQIQAMFENKKKNYISQKSELLQPKPQVRYCQICKEDYDDYFKHIKHPIHKKKQEQSTKRCQLDGLIESFQEKVKKSNFKRTSPAENKHVCFNLKQLNEDESQLKKKRITEQYFFNNTTTYASCKEIKELSQNSDNYFRDFQTEKLIAHYQF